MPPTPIFVLYWWEGELEVQLHLHLAAWNLCKFCGKAAHKNIKHQGQSMPKCDWHREKNMKIVPGGTQNGPKMVPQGVVLLGRVPEVPKWGAHVCPEGPFWWPFSILGRPPGSKSWSKWSNFPQKSKKRHLENRYKSICRKRTDNERKRLKTLCWNRC